MTLSHNGQSLLEAEMLLLKGQGRPFAMATVVRTVASTSARPGGKALLDGEGRIVAGWIGGGCAQGAIARAARAAIAAGVPQFISLQPQEVLDSQGLRPGQERDGVYFARNGCPSKGTMDIFVEPVLPLPELVICGSGLVALALADLAGRFDFSRTICTAPNTVPNTVSGTGVDARPDQGAADRIIDGFAFGDPARQPPFVVVATQGNGDLAALKEALQSTARYVGFVGSRKKFATLSDKLRREGAIDPGRISTVHSPAGLHLHAITPEEIALSILAQIISTRRAGDIPRP